MKTINTRDLVHHSKEIRKALGAGERILWKSRGKLIATLEPAQPPTAPAQKSWLERAHKAGAINHGDVSLSVLVYTDRD